MFKTPKKAAECKKDVFRIVQTDEKTGTEDVEKKDESRSARFRTVSKKKFFLTESKKYSKI